MLYKNYRFYLSAVVPFSEQEATKRKIELILSEVKNLGLIRVAIDLISQNQSISLLCQSKDDSAIEANVRSHLFGEKILVSEVTIETIHEDEEVVHGHSHHHPHAHDKHHTCHHDHHHHHHAHPDHQRCNHHDHTHDSHENHWLKAALGLIWGLGMLVISIASFNIPLLSYYGITGLTTLMTLYLGRSVYQSAWDGLLENRWDTTTLYTISTLTIVVVSIISMFVPGLPMIFEAAPLVLGFWHLGEGIEHTLVDEINKKLDVRDCVPPLVSLKGNPDTEISVKKLIPNDIIIVKRGNVIPVDGVLTTKTSLYTTRIDGSPELKEFQAGDLVKAGMRLADHITSLEMSVTKTYQNSYLSIIASNIDKAHEEKAPVEIFANQVLKYFIPGLLSIAFISGVIIGSLFTPALAIQCVVSVLVSACPCALSLITPLAVKIGMKKASEEGINFKNGKALQASADIDSVVFDLNGTLTKGEIVVNALHIADKDKKFLRHIALLESQSAHPTAKIIKTYIETSGLVSDESLEIDSVDKSHHSGIQGRIKGERFMIGNKNMLLANGINYINKPYDNPENGSIYIVRESTVIGQIDLVDPIRDDALATINQLKRLGKTVHLCTGAEQETAMKYATLLGISHDNVCVNAVGAVTQPDEVSKENYIGQLKLKGHKVAMIGDAANDASAIAHSDVGIAVQSTIGDDITQQHAGIVIQQGLLFPIATAFDVAEKTKQNIYQNLLVSLTYNSMTTLMAGGLFVALGFTLNPALGVALMVLESTIVLTNLYRFKGQEIVSATVNCKNPMLREKDSTSKLLQGLACSPLPKKASTPEEEPIIVNFPNSRSFFSASVMVSATEKTSHLSMLPTKEMV